MKEMVATCWGLLPVIVLIALQRWRASRGVVAVDALLQAMLLWATGIWILANLLGAAGALRPEPLRWVWLVLGAVALAMLWKVRSVKTAIPCPHGVMEWGLAGIVVILLGLTLVRAMVAPPNTVDVLNYHLPRQLMWLQQGGLDPYLTVNDRENAMPPLAEVIGVQFLGLTQGDRWANLVQWASYAGMALATVRLVRLLGGSRIAGLIAAILGLLLPMAYHEASNAKNDLLAAFWLIIAACRLTHWRSSSHEPVRGDAAWLGLAVSLAWLTKSTAMLFAPPLVLFGLWPWFKRTDWSRMTHVIGPAILLALVLIMPFHARNLAWYGNLLGEHRWEDGGDQIMSSWHPALLASNVMRHATLHLLGPWPEMNQQLLRAVNAWHDWSGIDVNDRRTTLWTLTFDPEYAPDVETSAGAPAHFIMGFPLLVLLAGGVGFSRRHVQVRWLACAVLGGAGLFCGLLKWQPWAARLEQPMFLLGIVAVVVAVEDWSRRWRGMAAACGLVAAIITWWPGADTVGRTLWTQPTLWAMPRDINYYRMLPRFGLREQPLIDVIKRSGAKTLLVHNLHDVPYPLMLHLWQRAGGVRFAGAPAHGAEAASADAVLVLSLGAPQPLYIDYQGRSDWRLVGAGAGDGLYVPAAEVKRRGLWDQLPDFGGWVRHEGLPAADWFSTERGFRVVREMPGEIARIAYEATGRQLRLEAELVIPVSPLRNAGRLELASGGATFARVSLPGAGNAAFEVDIPSSPGPHVIEFRRIGIPENFAFTKLRLCDEPYPDL